MDDDDRGGGEVIEEQSLAEALPQEYIEALSRTGALTIAQGQGPQRLEVIDPDPAGTAENRARINNLLTRIRKLEDRFDEQHEELKALRAHLNKPV